MHLTDISLDLVLTCIELLVGTAVVIGMIYLARNKALFESQRETIKTLAAEVAALTGKVERLERQDTEKQTKIETLQHCIDDKRWALKWFFDELAKSDRCTKAHDCGDRGLPEQPNLAPETAAR